MERRLWKIQPAIPEAQRLRVREEDQAAQGAEHFWKKPSSVQSAVYRAIRVRRFLDRQKKCNRTL